MVVLGSKALSLDEVYRILFGGEELALEQAALQQVNENFLFLSIHENASSVDSLMCPRTIKIQNS